MESRDELADTFRDLLATNRALLAEVKAMRQHIEIARLKQEAVRRVAIVLLLLVVCLPFLLLGGLWVMSLFNAPQSTEYWEQQAQKEQRRVEKIDDNLDRADKLAGRMETLVGRWEKAAPKE